MVAATIDAWSGGRPGPWTRDTTREWFIEGTQPGARKAIDRDGLLYRVGCGGWRVDPVKAELGRSAWRADVQDWLRRARGGVGRHRPVRLVDGVLLGRELVGRPAVRGVLPTAGTREAGEARQAGQEPDKPDKPGGGGPKPTPPPPDGD